MKNVMNTITIEQLDSVNVSLANRIRSMGEKLKTNDGNDYKAYKCI